MQPRGRPAVAAAAATTAAALCVALLSAVAAPRGAAALLLLGESKKDDSSRLSQELEDEEFWRRAENGDDDGDDAEGAASDGGDGPAPAAAAVATPPPPPTARFEAWAGGLRERHPAANAALRKAFVEAEHVERIGARRITALLQRASNRATSATQNASAYTFVGLAMMCLAAGVIVYLWVSMNSQDDMGVQQFKPTMEAASPNAMNAMNSAASLGMEPPYAAAGAGSHPSLAGGHPASAPKVPRRGRSTPCC